MSDYEKQLEAANKNLEEQLIDSKRKLSERMLNRFQIFVSWYNITMVGINLGNVRIATVTYNEKENNYTVGINLVTPQDPGTSFSTLDESLSYILKQLNLSDIIVFSDMKMIVTKEKLKQTDY